MNKVKRTVIWSLIVMTVSAYSVTYDMVYGNNTIEMIVPGYFGDIQKYLYLITMWIVPYMLILHIPYLESMIYVRMKNYLFAQLIRNNVINSIGVSLYIFFSFVTIAYVAGGRVIFRLDWILMLIRLILFVLACFIVCEMVYMMSKRVVAGAFAVLILNFLMIITMSSLVFLIYNNDVRECVINTLFLVYQLSMVGCGCIILLAKCKSKDGNI